MNRIQAAIKIARQEYAERSNDNIQIDDGPLWTPVDTGIWVQAWVFVENEHIDNLVLSQT